MCLHRPGPRGRQSRGGRGPSPGPCFSRVHEPTCDWGGPRSLGARPSALGSLSDNRPPCDGGVRLYRRQARRPTHPRRSVMGPPPFAALQPGAPHIRQFLSVQFLLSPPVHHRTRRSPVLAPAAAIALSRPQTQLFTFLLRRSLLPPHLPYLHSACVFLLTVFIHDYACFVSVPSIYLPSTFHLPPHVRCAHGRLPPRPSAALTT